MRSSALQQARDPHGDPAVHADSFPGPAVRNAPEQAGFVEPLFPLELLILDEVHVPAETENHSPLLVTAADSLDARGIEVPVLPVSLLADERDAAAAQAAHETCVVVLEPRRLEDLADAP